MNAEEILNNTDPSELRNILKRLKITRRPPSTIVVNQAPGQYPSSGVEPGASVVSETTYGQSPAVGTSNRYAHEDHTHGTPPEPALKTIEVFTADGALAVASSIASFVIPFASLLVTVYIYARNAGSASSTIVDVNHNGSSLFTLSARPTLAYNDSDGWAKGTPDPVALEEGEILSCDIDQVATGARNLSVTLVLQPTIMSADTPLPGLPSGVLDPYKPGGGDTDNVALSVGSSGAWDDTRIIHPYAVKFNGTVYLFYAGYHTAFNYSIGVASEAETGFTGKTFTKYGSNPVLTPGTAGAWDSAWVVSPWVIYDSDAGLWKMWYSGSKAGGSIAIGYATAPSPLGPWTKYAGNPILTPPGSGENAYYNVAVLRENATTYKMLYNDDDPAGPSKIRLATSTDGVNMTRSASNPVLSPSGSSWMAASVFSPKTFIKVNGIYQIYFNGKPTTTGFSKVGYAESTDLINWTLGANNPILSSTRAWEAGTHSPGEVENPNLIQVGSYQYLYYDVWYSSPSRLGVAIIPIP